MGIIMLEGNLKFNITLDPSVWIFDDRKVDLTTYFIEDEKTDNNNQIDARLTSRAWERETSGVISPPINKSVKHFEKERALTGSFGIPFKPFLINSEPHEDASKIIIETSSKETYVIPLAEAEKGILGFSKNGKPLAEDGPVHFYYGDGSNQEHPIKHVRKLIVK